MRQSTEAISVIIPTLENTASLQALLGLLKDQDVSEIIVVHSETHETKIPNSSANKYWLSAPKGRGSQIQRGLKDVKGDIVWILHADSSIPEQAITEIRHIMADSNISLGCFPLRFNASHFGLAVYAWLSRRATAWTSFGDQGFFFRRDDIAVLPDLSSYPLLEDVVIYRTLTRMGRIKKSRLPITTDVTRFLQLGIWRSQWRNAKILWCFYRGQSPEKLYALYYG